MTNGRSATPSSGPDRRGTVPSFPIHESKLTPPLPRRGMVPRGALRDRLDASAVTPVVAICAPPGYGKTTLLADWAERDPRPFAWLSIDGRDNDPAVLLTYITVALDRHEAIDRTVFGALGSPGASVMGDIVPRLGAALSTRAHPVVLVLDDIHLLHNQECVDAVAVLVDHLPARSQIVIASRGELPLPAGRLRAEGRIAEIGSDDLAMSNQEAGSLFRAADVELAEAEVAELTRRTEGWPVALYLAALAMKARGKGVRVAVEGRDRFLVDYLQSVLLSRLSPTDVRFLTRTAVLDRLSGPLCDAVLGTTGSADVLESLERSNLLVIPLDHHREWYRYHHLFRELLRAGLERHEPELVRELTLRAATWCEHNGLPETAIECAMDAGDADQVARLLERLAFPAHRVGRDATLQTWFGWLETNGRIERYPAVAALGAWVQAFSGRPAAVERWADAAERGLSEKPPASGSASLDGWGLALLNAVLCRDGMEQMRADAELALARLPVGSIWRPTAHLLLGISYLLAGDHRLADGVLADAVEVAEDGGGTIAVSVALAERSILAMEREEWIEAESHVERARSVVREAHLDDYVSSVLVYAAAARVAVHQGDARRAHEDLARAQRLRPQLTYALPVFAVQARLELVRAYLALTDVAGARTVLREADDVLRRRPHLGILQRQADELRSQLGNIRAEVIGASSLTAAEMRLLPLLSTHHSFREIGERLHVSQHTVKSQAMSVYRKLGVSSRSQAIHRARALGLLAA
jgi:LuxR family transcriptional regulator, maltose regulon positive regulatory protein